MPFLTFSFSRGRLITWFWCCVCYIVIRLSLFLYLFLCHWRIKLFRILLQTLWIKSLWSCTEIISWLNFYDGMCLKVNSVHEMSVSCSHRARKKLWHLLQCQKNRQCTFLRNYELTLMTCDTDIVFFNQCQEKDKIYASLTL